MAARVVWTKTAQSDREQIFEFWNEQNGTRDYSQKLNEQIRKRIELTKLYPEAGLATNLQSVRFHIIDKHYKLFYKIGRDNIVILRFWDTRQDPDSLKI